MRPPFWLAIAATIGLATSGCENSQYGQPAPGWGAETRTWPPEDFWIAVTVMGPARATGTEADLPARPLRPARYVVEPDRMLRAALGAGVREQYFPPQTRRLSGEEFGALWREVGRAGLLGIGGGGVAPAPDTIGNTTVYVIETHADGKRSLLVTEADPDCGSRCAKAKKVVEWLAGRAWQK